MKEEEQGEKRSKIKEHRKRLMRERKRKDGGERIEKEREKKKREVERERKGERGRELKGIVVEKEMKITERIRTGEIEGERGYVSYALRRTEKDRDAPKERQIACYAFCKNEKFRVPAKREKRKM